MTRAPSPYSHAAVAVTLACLVVPLLSSCSNDTPTADRHETASPPRPLALQSTANSILSSGLSTPLAAPTSTPERPKVADELTLSAAEAFVRHYIDLLNYASATGDSVPLLSASDGGCRQCRVYAKYVENVNGVNGRLTGATLSGSVIFLISFVETAVELAAMRR